LLYLVSVDLRLIAIADPAVLGGRDLIEAARRAQRGGATMIQLRMKHASTGEIFQMARKLVQELEIPVYINDRADVALAAGARGVHLGVEDLPAAAVRDFAPQGFGIGLSVGNEEEVRLLGASPVDYWSIGSIFRTSTKPDAGEPIGIEGFRRVARQAPPGMSLVAIGGIDASNAAQLIRAGAHGVAVISAVFGVSDVEGAARRIREAVDREFENRASA
jgi:thiamine-phosphate pyrophosphorylase